MAEYAERLLKLFPGTLAGGVALVYILGAIVTGSQFSGAGIDPSVAVPLLSIDQLLARGVGVLVQPTAFLWGFTLVMLIVQAFVMPFLLKHDGLRQKNEHSTAGRKRSSRLRRTHWRKRMVVILGFITLLTLLLVPVDQLLGSAIMLGGLWAVISALLSDTDFPRLQPMFLV